MSEWIVAEDGEDVIRFKSYNEAKAWYEIKDKRGQSVYLAEVKEMVIVDDISTYHSMPN